MSKDAERHPDTKTRTPATVIYNGPSRESWRDYHFPGYVLGCNYAYRDFRLTHCWAVDRMTVAHIRGELENKPLPCEFWTRESVLELPPDWNHMKTPGIDSGSAAVAHALELTSAEVIVIGADGVLGGSNDTAYTFPWHPNGPNEKTHRRHSEYILTLQQRNPRILIVSDIHNPQFKTISKLEALEVFNKYTANEEA